MIKTKGSGRRGGRAALAIAVLVGAAGVVLVGSVGTASAARVFCKGTVSPKEKGKPSIDARYAFSCNQDIRSYSVITNRKFDFFGTEIDVFRDGTSSGQTAILQCEGPIPGSGFGCGTTNRNTPSGCGSPTTAPCTNRVTADSVIAADLGFARSPCRRKPGEDALKVWLVVGNEPFVESQAGAGTTTTAGDYTSEPFALKIKGYSPSACAAESAENRKAKGGPRSKQGKKGKKATRG